MNKSRVMVMNEKSSEQKLESYHESFMNALSSRKWAIEDFYRRPVLWRRFEVGMRNEVTRSYFLYYLDEIFRSEAPEERNLTIAQAFVETDDSQVEFNKREQYTPHIYDLPELMGKIALKTAMDTEEQAKKELEKMFDQDLYNPVMFKIFHERE